MAVVAAAQELGGGEAFLANHRVVGKRLAEDLGRKFEQTPSRVLVVADDRGRSAHRHHVTFGAAQPGLEAADQAGHVGALGAVVGVQFVQHQDSAASPARCCAHSGLSSGRSSRKSSIL